MAAETIWVAVTDLSEVLSAETLSKLDENIGLPAGSPYNPAGATRSKALVASAVAELRDAIRNAGRCPISLGASEVPAGSKTHVLNMAKWRLVNSKPSLVQVLLESNPELNREFQEAQQHYKSLARGATVATPTNPTGKDYATAVSASNPLPSLVSWADATADDQEYAAGEKVDPATGQAVALPVDEMRTDPL